MRNMQIFSVEYFSVFAWLQLALQSSLFPPKYFQISKKGNNSVEIVSSGKEGKRLRVPDDQGPQRPGINCRSVVFGHSNCIFAAHYKLKWVLYVWCYLAHAPCVEIQF